MAGVAVAFGFNWYRDVASNRRDEAKRRQDLRLNAYGDFVRNVEAARESLNDDTRNNLRRANNWIPMVGTDDAVKAADTLAGVALGETTGDYEAAYQSFVSAARSALKTDTN